MSSDDIAFLRAQEESALSQVLASVGQGAHPEIERTLRDERSGMSFSNPAMQQAYGQFARARRARQDAEHRARSVAAAIHRAVPVTIAIPSAWPGGDSRSIVSRRAHYDEQNVILLPADASAPELAVALAFLRNLRAKDGDDLLNDIRLSIGRVSVSAQAVPQREEELLQAARQSTPRPIGGVGEARAVVFQLSPESP